jgi:hypothetical protein
MQCSGLLCRCGAEGQYCTGRRGTAHGGTQCPTGVSTRHTLSHSQHNARAHTSSHDCLHRVTHNLWPTHTHLQLQLLTPTFAKMRSMSVEVRPLPISLVSLHSLMKFLPSISTQRCCRTQRQHAQPDEGLALYPHTALLQDK